jgi:hypothetical protein
MHQYVTVIGDAYGGLEHWQFGLRLSLNAGNNTNVALALAPHVQNWWLAAAPYYGQPIQGQFASPTTHRLSEVKVATINLDGTYTNEAAYSHFYPCRPWSAPAAGRRLGSPRSLLIEAPVTAAV